MTRLAILLRSALLILTLVCVSQTMARSQKYKVTIKAKEQRLLDVFKTIQQQTKLIVFYSNTILNDQEKVSIQVKDEPLEKVLDQIVFGKALKYEVQEKYIVISPKEEKKSHGSTIPGINPGDIPPPPTKDISGKVTDAEGNPLAGASIKVRGGTLGTSTNADGVFVLKGVDEKAVIEIGFVGYETLSLPVGSRTSFMVSLKVKEETLQEVVVNKGYYTEKQKFSTSNVVSVKAKDIEKQPVNNPLLALVGRVPGLQVQQQTGFANSGITVRIQGTNSLGAGLEPLYVIDGVPYGTLQIPSSPNVNTILGYSISGVGGNPLSLLNPQDIESIDVLKDADATAIYGSRAANGAILITTKKGKGGKTQVGVNFRSGWGNVANKVKLLNTQQYLEMRKEAYLNDGLSVPNQNTAPNANNYDLTFWDQNRYTDWQDALIGGTAHYTDAQVTTSGGNANTQFLIGVGYHKETTVMPGDFSDRKGSLQFNINHSDSKQKFKIQLSGTYVVDNNQVPLTDLTSFVMRIVPNAPKLYKEDGSLNWEPIVSGSGTVSSWVNPLSSLKNRYNANSHNLISRALISYQLLQGLSISSSFGYNNVTTTELATFPLEGVRPERRASSTRSGHYGNGTTATWVIEPQITFNKKIGNGKLEALVGTTFQRSDLNRQFLIGIGHNSDLLIKNVLAASSVFVTSIVNAAYRYNAVYSRINYNWRDKYIANFTARRDGSSRFGSENLFANFYSAGAAWVFSNEEFISKNFHFLSFGKLRASYGTSGNDQIGDYQFMNLFNPVSVTVLYQGIPALQPSGHTNPYLQWEETRKLQFGLDLGFLKDRAILNINYYYNRSSNLLISSALSSITGFGAVKNNFEGIVQNTGWEFSLNTTNVQGKGFNWTTNLNFTIPTENGVLKSFPNLQKSIYANQYVEGRSILEQRRYRYGGVDPATGKYSFIDASGNLTFSPAVTDLTQFVNTSQRLYGGIQNNIRYKDFQFDFTFQFVKRKAVLFYGDQPGFFHGTFHFGNLPGNILDRWQKPGDISSFQRYTTLQSGDVYDAENLFDLSDGSIVDANYFKLTNLSISWNLPKKWMKAAKLQNAMLYGQAQNLFTITKYKGLDPSTGGSAGLPPLRVVTIGCQVTF